MDDLGGKARLSAVARLMQVREPDDGDVAWRALQARMLDGRRARARRRVWLAIPTFTLAVAGALIVGISFRHGGADRAGEQGIEVGRPFESADAEVALALPDGIQVDLDRRSRVRLESVAPEEIRVALNKGSARFDVEPHRPRRVIVDADDVEVRVVGTRFRVTRIEGATAEDEARIEQDYFADLDGLFADYQMTPAEAKALSGPKNRPRIKTKSLPPAKRRAA
jgi:ferric-dicitrate binding protein FerR (iron transport regulator)